MTATGCSACSTVATTCISAAALIAFNAKHDASIAGAEVGCQGEIGVASALEHLLGMTCDPVGGYVQCPCIERNAVGAVMAADAYTLSPAGDPERHKVTFDEVVAAMMETGRDMPHKYQETARGGLAVSVVSCRESAGRKGAKWREGFYLSIGRLADVPGKWNRGDMVKRKEERPGVVILATGGTIAGRGASEIRPAYTSGQVAIDDMIAAVPGLSQLAHIEGEQVASLGSQDMTFAIMTALAGRVNELLADEAVDGVVITHGTDTMEETAFFLNLTVDSRKPVVMTGAMRPATALSADGPLNLYNAVAVAADPAAADRGVLVVMNDRIHGAHSLTKTNTTSVETFLSPITGLIGTVVYGQTQYFRKPFRRHTDASEFSPARVSAPLPRVDILYACADMPADLVDCSVACGARGIVIAGDGNGNMNAPTIERAARASAGGVVIVRSSRVPSGKVSRNIEIDDDALGFIVSDELNPVKARILLMLALVEERGPEELQQLFYTY